MGGAQEELKAFLEKANIPAGRTMLGLSALPSDHPLNMGMLGMHGSYSTNMKTQECDVLIAIGMRFDDRVTGDVNRYAKQAKIIHLDIDNSELGKNVKVDVPVLGDCKATLPAITQLLEVRKHTAWIESFGTYDRIEMEKVIEPAIHPKEGPLLMAEVINVIADQTNGEAKVVKFYNPGHENDHLYTVAHKWSEDTGDFFGDVPAMCRLLSKRGLRAVDLLLGADVYDAVLNMEKVQRLLDKSSGIIVGKIEQELSAYDGVTYGGTLNFRGYKLNLISVDETYVDTANAEQRYFPKTDALITAPACGHLMYGAITQINYGDTQHSTIAARRVPKFSIDQENDVRKMSLKTRPLAAPKNYIPWIRAKNVVG